jgi:inosine-uridine nucleoside N-ribohydrolase
VREELIHDCDPGHDDAVALLLALASPEAALVGVTTVAGNQTVEKTTANALRILEFAGRGETGLDGPELPQATGTPVGQHAVDFLAAHAGGRTLVATGPLTNLGLLLALHPTVRPKRIVLMGGAIGEGNTTPAAEFNVWADPEAARRVLESGLDVTMVGLDVTHRAVVTPAVAEELRAAGRAGKLVAELVDFYSRFHRRRYPELGGSPLHDPVALAYALRPELLEVRPARVEVDCSWGAGRGRTNVDLRGRGGEPNAAVAVGIDAEAFVRLLVERIASLG